MDINPEVVMKNLGTFAHAYGLEPKSQSLLEGIRNSHVESIGVLLRDSITKKGLISCQFPVNGDITNQMLWVPVNDRPVEAVPICTREVKPESMLKNVWKRLKDKMSEDHFYEIEEGNFTMRVHHSFVKQGVIESYMPAGEFGFIRRARSLYFKKKWCDLDCIKQGKEVSFIPIISRRGLQARAIEEVTL